MATVSRRTSSSRCWPGLLTAAYLCAFVLWIDGMLGCAGQRPKNIGTKKRDVYIAGFFPYGSHVPESHIGRGVMPSVKLAVDHINENRRVLKNYRLHMWWNDTECNAAVGVKAFFDMMHSGPHKVMLFGAACTHVTDPIAKASKHWRLTQLSYADTHPMFTSNSFPNFFRVVPSENAFNAPRVALLMHFNWTRVGTIYQNEPRYALAHNRLLTDLDGYSMEVVESQSFATEVTTALEKLKEKDVRIILGNFNEAWARRIFCEAYRFGMFGRKYQWVIMGTYANDWWMHSGGGCNYTNLVEALQGAILTDLLPIKTEEQETVAGITTEQYQFEYDSRRGGEYSRFHGYTYDGIWAVALAIERVAGKITHHRRNQTMSDFRYRDEFWEELFLEALKNTSFEGVTGLVRFYDNERRAYILLKQFQRDREVKVGEFNGMTGVLNLSKGEPLVWGGKSPPKDRTLHIIEQSTVNITIYALLASAASVGITMAAIFLAINIKYRNQRYIKMSSPHLNNLIIVGCMLTYSSVIFLGLDSQLSSVTAFPYICTARAWLLMAGFSLAFGSMFSKTWRVHSIFTDVKLNKKVIKDYQLFMVVGVLLVIDLGIMTTWQVADPFYRETKQMEPYPHPSSEDIIIIPENEYCQSNRMTIYLGCIYAYKGVLMIFGAFLAWETRHVSIPALNDSKYVGMSVYNVVIMCVTGAAISFVLADKQDAMFIMLAIFIIFCSTATLCLVFVPKLIELRRNPQGAIDKRIRATLRPMSKTRRDSSISELEERLKEATLANQKFRKQLLEKDSELQMFLRRIDDQTASNTQEAMDRLTVPRQEGTTVKKEGLSVTTETTDISMSMCSLNSTTTSQPEGGDYTNSTATEHQIGKKKTSFSKVPAIAIDSERVPLVPEMQEIKKGTVDSSTSAPPSALKHVDDFGRRRSRSSGPGKESEPLLTERSPDSRPDAGKTNVEFVPEIVEEGDAIILEETEIPRHGKSIRSKDDRRSRLPTPPPTKNVSFGELHEQNYLEQAILPPPLQFVPKHRHSVAATNASAHHSLKRRSSVKSNGMAHSHHELFQTRRTSVPANCISYISTENVSKSEATEISLNSGLDKSYVIGECGHRRALLSGTGYRCEKHGGRRHSRTMLNGSAETPPPPRRQKKHYDSQNASSPSVPAMVNASYSDTEKYEGSMSTIIQRSVSERSREKCPRLRGEGHAMIECPHRATRRIRECRHTESKLRQQARLEYVQSTPNVATIHNNKFASANPRGGGSGGGGGSGVAGSANGPGTASSVTGSSSDVVGGSAANVSKMYSAVSDGELLDLAILPIFQKLLTERHKSSSRAGYGASVASCPNISIKCDIVEYL
ncbi:gamma-aminobutyric acid type B receptor subunit 2 isoform X1 [Bombus vosnesenskii]|uniref:Gamma-aminobutyric acid type B receptor subunit 2 n=4 Tax=Pyrobombus TaxID=144703 RepID=A0A6J3LD19_9HYME|nr:gamma-aminobutyric acid type B receptor subunit 2 isoform X1 [Bombus impatiens]XP_033179144.1 gamma-aminobutyric acid type B receptor subunit 2 isoform X2 [Bombus impatiens]XP_033361824.1 gamma-aminobutyric acid type B receptor subunit 2 isoform X1 [Bombus vosnesenskii]